METDKTIILKPVEPTVPSQRSARTRIAIAFAVAGVSDILAFWAEIAPPFLWALDLVTAFALYVILGKRWALLPGLIAEAIPGVALFPAWVLVVLSIAIYDGIKRPHRA